MSNLAFYAPMKSPTHPIPSGDRAMAQGILAALKQNPDGMPVELVSELRIYDKHGDNDVQQQLLQQATAEIEKLITIGRKNHWRAWVTYHNYYKSPDLLGPAVCDALSIPYLIIEASITNKQSTGRWAKFSALADNACTQADVIFYLTERDRPELQRAKPLKQKLLQLAPFLNRTHTNQPQTNERANNRLLAVGMHRNDVKLDSYQAIAQSLDYLNNQDWTLTIVGSGPAHNQVRDMFSRFGHRVYFTGQLDQAQLAQHYQQSTVFIWPGVNEAFGMVYLEAQAAGLPVIAEDRPGVREVVATNEALVAQDSPPAFAAAIDGLLSSAQLRQQRGAQAAEFVQQSHLLHSATDTLCTEIALLMNVRP